LVTVKFSWKPPDHELTSDHVTVQPLDGSVGVDDADADALAVGVTEALGEAVVGVGLEVAEPGCSVTTVTEYGVIVWVAALPPVPVVIPDPGSASVETDGVPAPGVKPA
jgi:hypothetical protein